MADALEGGFAQDPNPEQTQRLGINLPQVDVPQQDALLHITVHPNPEQAQQESDQRQLQDELQQEADFRKQQLQKPDTWAKVGTALQQGASRNDAAEYLAQTQGISPDDADAQLVSSVQDKLGTALKNGYSEQEVRDFMKKKGVDQSLVDDAFKSLHTNKGFENLDFNPNVKFQEAQDLNVLYQNVYQKYSDTARSLGWFNSTDDAMQARYNIDQINRGIARQLTERGYKVNVDPDSGQLMYTDENGGVRELTTPFLKQLYASKSEMVGGMAGGAVGFRAGGPVGAELGFAAGDAIAGPPGGFVGAGLGYVAGSYTGMVAGSAIGATAGRGLDLAYNSLALQEDLSRKLYWTQMKEAGAADAVLNVLGSVAFKVGATGLRGLVRGYKMVRAGNSKGAYQALLENLHLTDTQAQDIVKQWEKLNGKVAPGSNLHQRAISVLTTTQQGGEIPVAKAAAQDPKLYRSVLTDINDRSKGLQKAVNDLNDPNVGQRVREDIKAHRKDVKDYYGQVRDIGANAIDGTDYRFDFNHLAVEPVLNSIEKSISDPTARERFVLLAARIANASKDRTFSGLVDLRQAVNDFKYNKLNLNKRDKDALNAAINRIDKEIASAAKQYMGGGADDWLNMFKNAKGAYRDMKLLEENALFKAVTRKTATEQTIRTAISKYGKANEVNEEVFNSIIDRLQGATRQRVEVAAIKNLIDNAEITAGKSTDLQATNFPLLAEKLRTLNLKSPAAKSLQTVVDEMAKVFKNDWSLAGVSSSSPNAKIQSAMSSDLLAKAKYSLVQEVWNAMMKFVPGKTSHNLALVNQVSKLLENPLHTTTADKLIQQLPTQAQPNATSMVKQLQVEVAKMGANALKKQSKDWLNMYKQSANGQLAVSDGALGRGIYLFDKIANPTPEMKVIKHEVNLSRMATLQDMKAIMGRDVDLKEIRNLPKLRQALVDKGYLGIRVDGKAMLFPETTLKKPKAPKGK